MKRYLFLTTDGSTYAGDGHIIENCQLLGEGEGETVKEAYDSFIEENNINKEEDSYTFSEDSIYAVEVIGDNIYSW